MAYNNPMSPVGSPTPSKTITKVTRPAEGIAAVPTDTAAAVKL